MLEKQVTCPCCQHGFAVAVARGFVEPEVTAELMCPACCAVFGTQVETQPTPAAVASRKWRQANPQGYKLAQMKYKNRIRGASQCAKT